MARYSTNNRLAGTQQVLTTTYKSQISLAVVRGSLVDMDFGADGVPNATDCNITYDVSRMTAVGTSTAATPNPFDNVAGAASVIGAVNFTAEPTVTAASSLYMVPLNQRASLRVFLDQGIKWPAGAGVGIVFRALSPNYAAAVGVTLVHDE